ncbi:D-alanine--D-alanine ligase [Dysgonomonas sp. 520]|uniref:D-alanine--D-alanine ligase n=1 Tax=Dysgonomonas sp. 520 TaxID=2302931 RepID=UPI0013D1E6AF|nr:D-alanine--D-alanine ligase [Dysgonomonas sp. 520]NDW10263.1 D-alanine--D-alanine ligase [Dysgonomonas sp. 520]
MKKNIAVVWGGYSSEWIVSEKSMVGICSFLDTKLYNVYSVKIDRQSWNVVADGAEYPVDKNDFSFSVEGEKVNIDFAYITIHGTPGEDGHLQGYFDMIGMPYSSCGLMASALTFNKYICNNYLKNFGITVAKSRHFTKDMSYDLGQVGEELGYPLFVKPNTGGSSFATTKVKSLNDFQKAMDDAFNEAEDVVAESFISGVEVTCGCYKIGNEKTLLPLTEVVTTNEFFDYNAKYAGQVEEITPARISEEMTLRIQQLTSRIYDLVGAKGIIRADFIISDNVPFLLEVNTTPGMTVTSFIPQQVKAAGLSMTDVLTDIIEEEYKKVK